MYGVSISSVKTMTFAFGSCDLIARNAAKLAVPPPINKYGTSFGISDDVGGIFAEIKKNYSVEH